MERTVTISVKEVLLDRQWDDGVSCAKYIQQKLFLENKVLKLIATINPGMIVTNSKSEMKYLMNLPSLI